MSEEEAVEDSEAEEPVTEEPERAPPIAGIGTLVFGKWD